MRLVIIGERRLGEKALEALAGRGEDIAGVFTPEVPGGRSRMKDLAMKLGIPVFPLKKARSAEFYAQYAALKADLNVLPLLTSVLPTPVLEYPRLGTICLHPSLLPRYGGLTPICWPLINGDTRTGVTVFYPDAGIDTGPILLQKEIEIAPEDTQESLYQRKILPAGLAALLEAVDLIKEGKAPRVPQDRSQASYYPPCTEADAVINWVQPAQRIYNLIRGTYPVPGASTRRGDVELKVLAAKPSPGYVRGQPGEIIEISGEGLRVSAPDGSLLISEVGISGRKLPAAEVASSAGLRAGERLR